MSKTDTSSATGPLASWEFDLKYMVDGKHSTILLLPPEYHALIGRIIAHWGNFEVVFDYCLEALLAGEAADGKMRKTPDWKRQSFKSRRKLFENICNEWLSTWQPQAAKELLTIIQTAARLHADRNLIAHGTYGYTIPPHSSIATNCYAYSHSNGEKLHFDAEVLKKLYHDIAHLTADLIQVFRSFGKVEGPHQAIPDSEVMRVYRESVHPWNPDPSKRPNVLERKKKNRAKLIAALVAAVIVTLELFLLVSGKRILVEEVKVEPGQKYEVPNYGNLGANNQASLACKYFTGRSVVTTVFWCSPNNVLGKDACPFLYS